MIYELIAFQSELVNQTWETEVSDPCQMAGSGAATESTTLVEMKLESEHWIIEVTAYYKIRLH